MNIPTLEDSGRKFYTIEYFITRFCAIPEELWYVTDFTNPNNPAQHCAYGHLGCEHGDDENPEANALDRLFREHGLTVWAVNDGTGSKTAGAFAQATPKLRILAALESFR